MSKELIAILALSLTLLMSIFGFGMRIGTLTTTVEQQTKQLDALSLDLRAINQHFIIWASTHKD